MMYLNYYKQYEDVLDPKFSTEGSACFDIHAYLKPGTVVSYFDELNNKQNQFISNKLTFDNDYDEEYVSNPSNSVIIYPNCRMMIPTGIILDIPENYSVRVHSRSSLALKKGLRLANSEGVIDYDYVDPLYVLLHNTTKTKVIITDCDRIAQCEMIPMFNYKLEQSTKAPQTKTNRTGGFGSTGK